MSVRVSVDRLVWEPKTTAATKDGRRVSTMTFQEFTGKPMRFAPMARSASLALAGVPEGTTREERDER